MSDKTIRVVAHLTTISEKVDEVKAILAELAVSTRQEEGCIKYELMQNKTEPTDFTFVEEWASDTALDTHLELSYITTASQKLVG